MYGDGLHTVWAFGHDREMQSFGVCEGYFPFEVSEVDKFGGGWEFQSEEEGDLCHTSIQIVDGKPTNGTSESNRGVTNGTSESRHLRKWYL